MRFGNIRLVGATLMAGVTLYGCTSPPTSSPRCPGGEFWTEPVDTDGDTVPDAIGGGWRWHFIGPCTVPGSDVGGGLQTVGLPGGGREYRFVVTEGPAAGTDYKIEDVYDAISAMDQLFKASNYDMNYTETAQYRADLKQWIIDNWMSADDFHNIYGY